MRRRGTRSIAVYLLPYDSPQACAAGLSVKGSRRGMMRDNEVAPGDERTRPLITDCLVVIPTYNERENVPVLLPQVLAHPRLSVLVVDDGSPDGTGDFVAAEMEDEPRLHLIRRSGKQGLGTAYLAGFAYALDRNAA